MEVIFKQTNKFSWWVNHKEYVMLHHTGNMWEWNIDVLSTRNNQASCHFLVMQDWRVYQFASLDAITRHAGKWSYEWITDSMNNYAIWIEIESDGIEFTDIQKERVRGLLESFDFEYKLIRHKDYAPGRKWDVWDNFWINEYATFEDYKASINNNSERINKLKTQKIYLKAIQKIMQRIIEDKELKDIFIDETISYNNICMMKITDIDNEIERLEKTK